MKTPREMRISALITSCAVALTVSAGATIAWASTTYFPVTPCRVVDTRSDGEGLALTGKTSREFVVKGTCGIPASAKAISYNATIVHPEQAGYLAFYPSGGEVPVVSALNFSAGSVVGNGGVVSLGDGENDLAVYLGSVSAGSEAHMVLDVTGYFG